MRGVGKLRPVGSSGVEADQFAGINGVFVAWIDLGSELDKETGEQVVFTLGLLEQELAAGEQESGKNLWAVIAGGFPRDNAFGKLEMGYDRLPVTGGEVHRKSEYAPALRDGCNGCAFPGNLIGRIGRKVAGVFVAFRIKHDQVLGENAGFDIERFPSELRFLLRLQDRQGEESQDSELPKFHHRLRRWENNGHWQVTNPDDMLAEYLAGHTVRMHRKRKLRQDLRRRMEINTGNSAVVAREVANYLDGRPELKVVAVYSALPGEVDLKSLTEMEGRVWVFPKVEGADLVFYQVGNVSRDMEVGAFGILEPGNGLARVDIAKIDLFLCPGLGFDLKGGRVGRGRGFYDRALAKSRPGSVKLGVCFGYQLVDETEMEMESHDIRMNAVIAG